MKQRIGANIRAGREAAGLTRRQLAAMSGMQPAAIANIELGRARPGRDKADLIAAALAVDVAVLTCADELDRPLIQRGPRGSSWSTEYFWQRIDKHGPDECRPWTGTLKPTGYGTLTFQGEGRAAYRLAYELSIGPVPEGLELDHTCHDPKVCHAGNDCPHRRCCNPAHLEAVTHAVNLERSRRRGRGPSRTPNPGITTDQRFGLYVRAARQQAGLRQAELAEMVGLGTTSVCRIEAGVQCAKEAHRAALIAALSLDPGDLLTYLNPDPPGPLFGLDAAS